MKGRRWPKILLAVVLVIAGLVVALELYLSSIESELREELARIEANWQSGRRGPLVPESDAVAGNAWEQYLALTSREDDSKPSDEEIRTRLREGARCREATLTIDELRAQFDSRFTPVELLQFVDVLLRDCKSARERGDLEVALGAWRAHGIVCFDLAATTRVSMVAFEAARHLARFTEEGVALLERFPDASARIRKVAAVLDERPLDLDGIVEGDRWFFLRTFLAMADREGGESQITALDRRAIVLLLDQLIGRLDELEGIGGLSWAEAQKLAIVPAEGPDRSGAPGPSSVGAGLVGDLTRPWILRAQLGLLVSAARILSGEELELPRDPFGEGSLRRRREGADLVLWSRGPNGRDDAGVGKLVGAGNGFTDEDIVLRVRRK